MATRRNDHEYTKRRDALKRKAKASNSPCHLCKGAKGPILYEEDYRHPLSFTADHVDAVGNGGRMLGLLMPAHRTCNSSRGKKQLEEFLDAQARKRVAKPRTTRSWY